MNEQEYFKEKTETNVFVQILQKYLPFWPLFALTVTIALSVSYVYLRSQIPVYVATAKVLLKDPNKGGGDSKVLDALNIFSEKKIVENEILVLKSSGIVTQVVDSLDLYATVYNQGKVKVEELYGLNCPVSFIALQKDSILSYGTYYFKINWQQRNVTISNQEVAFGSVVNLSGADFRLLINPKYNQNLQGKNYFVKVRPVDAAAGEIIASLKVNPISNASTVLDIKLESPEPYKAKDILSKLFDVYNAEGIDDKNQIAKRTLYFIDDRLRLVQNQLDSVEKRIEDYKSRESVYGLGEEGDVYFRKVQDLDSRKAQTDLQLDVLSEIKNYVLKKGKKPGTVPSLSLIQDPILGDLLTQLYSAEFELEKAKDFWR
ncbi:MAG: hypothetical protein IPP72_19160 [Chitinophagaceae bacterium]|nr:hypothetical protein [Chitinophagaceae bacterium]